MLVITLLIMPLLTIFLLLEGMCGNAQRAYNMELAIDCCGNALFGGSPKVSISNRTGLGVIAGYKWAIRLAPVIDFFFGVGHCADAAATKQ